MDTHTHTSVDMIDVFVHVALLVPVDSHVLCKASGFTCYMWLYLLRVALHSKNSSTNVYVSYGHNVTVQCYRTHQEKCNL